MDSLPWFLPVWQVSENDIKHAYSMWGIFDAQIAKCTWCSWTARSPWLLRALQTRKKCRTCSLARCCGVALFYFVHNVIGTMHVQEWDTRCDVIVYAWHCSLLRLERLR